MFVAGIKFGIGFWLATITAVAVAMLVPTLVSYVGRCFPKRKSYPKLTRTGASYMLWTRAPESVHRGDGTQIFSFRTTVRWGDRNRHEDRRKEPHYRY